MTGIPICWFVISMYCAMPSPESGIHTLSPSMPGWFCRIIFMPCGRCHQTTMTSPPDGDSSREASRATSRSSDHDPEVGIIGANDPSGNVVTGNTSSATNGITNVTWITFISTRSSTVMSSRWGIGSTRPSIEASNAACIRPSGPIVQPGSRVYLENATSTRRMPLSKAKRIRTTRQSTTTAWRQNPTPADALRSRSAYPANPNTPGRPRRWRR